MCTRKSRVFGLTASSDAFYELTLNLLLFIIEELIIWPCEGLRFF
jgi:hypothetical protein